MRLRHVKLRTMLLRACGPLFLSASIVKKHNYWRKTSIKTWNFEISIHETEWKFQIFLCLITAVRSVFVVWDSSVNYFFYTVYYNIMQQSDSVWWNCFTFWHAFYLFFLKMIITYSYIEPFPNYKCISKK